MIFKLLSVVLLSAVILSGCKKYDEQAFDFSTSAPPYIALKTYTDKFVSQGTNLKFVVLVRTALPFLMLLQAILVYLALISFQEILWKEQ